MLRLTTATLVKLRDRLRERGARPSMALGGMPASYDELLAATIASDYGPLCEVMYIMMAADGVVAGVERDVLRGALRELDPRIRSAHVEAMLAEAATALETEGRARRFYEIAQALEGDPARAEAAFQLAAAVAVADDVLAAQEKEVMKELGEALGIPLPRARQLFQALEQVGELVAGDAALDATDVLLHTAMRVASPEDFERLAATAKRADVRLMLRLYAAFARSGEEMRDKPYGASGASEPGPAGGGFTPRSLSSARIASLEAFAESLPADGSPNAQAIRTTLVRLARALAAVDKATGLRPLASDAALSTLEDALARLAQVSTNARLRCGEMVAAGPATIGELSSAVAHAVEKRDGGELERAIESGVRRAERSVPPEIASIVALVVRRLSTLPLERPSAPPRASNTAPAADSPLPEWLPSRRVLGGFYVLSTLGGGGAASVLVVTRSDERDEPNAERFALKVPQYDATAARAISEAEFLKMFREEAGALLSLPEHPNLAGFITFDAGARPKPVLVMELIEGAACDALITGGTLTTARAVALLDGVLAGLGAMHGAGVGHLDLKPSNVIVRPSGDPVLVDFGLAGRHLRPGCATGPYGAPEVWGLVTDDATPTPLCADVYSFGCLAFEVMTGRTLFDAPNELACIAAHVAHDGFPEPVARLSKDARFAPLATVLYHCLRRNARERPDVAAIRAELRRIQPALSQLPWPIAT